MQKVFNLELEEQNNDQKRVLSAHDLLVCFEHFGGIQENFLLTLLALIKGLFVICFLGFFTK